MRPYSERRNPARLLLRRLGVVGLLCLVAAALWGVWGVRGKERDSAALRAEAEMARDELLQRQARLEAELAQLATDRGLEEQLRRQYGLAAEGESLIVIVDPATATPLRPRSSPVREWIERTFSWW